MTRHVATEESHSYSRRLPALKHISQQQQSEHWAEITFNKRNVYCQNAKLLKTRRNVLNTQNSIQLCWKCKKDHKLLVNIANTFAKVTHPYCRIPLRTYCK